MLEFASEVRTIKQKAFKCCIDNEMSLGLALRDINLAASNQITGTPTLFINGRRVQGVKDAAELSRLVEEAKASANKTLAPNTVAVLRGGTDERVR